MSSCFSHSLLGFNLFQAISTSCEILAPYIQKNGDPSPKYLEITYMRVKLTWLENGYPFFSIYVFSLSKMGIPSSVRYVNRVGGSPATSGNSPDMPWLTFEP